MEMKKLFILVLSIWLPSQAFSYENLDSDTVEEVTFEMLLDSNNMIFVAPVGFIETEPKQNGQMNYEKSYKHPTEKFEVRYAIRKHNFGWYKQMFEMTAKNISGGSLPEYTNFGTDAVKREFNADAGCVITLIATSEFAQGYKYCLFVYIYKKGIGDGYVFYMADDNEIIPDLMMPIFHALKFE